MALKFHNFYSFASLKTECLALFEAAAQANTQRSIWPWNVIFLIKQVNMDFGSNTTNILFTVANFQFANVSSIYVSHLKES